MPNDRPFVAAALICEKVLTEGDGVMSAIRIVDTFLVHDQPEMAGVTPAVHLTALLSLKSGDVTGESVVRIQFRSPTGEVFIPTQTWPVLLRGQEHGANLRLEFDIPVVLGLHWLDVIWNDIPLTSVPFKLARVQDYQAPRTGRPGSPPAPAGGSA